MSVESLMELLENLFDLEQIRAVVETNNILIFEEITRELEVYLLKVSNDADSTDGVFDFLTSLADQVQGEFEELLDGYTNKKKRFLRALSKIFALLLNTKVDPAEKIKKLLKIAVETTIKIWQEPKPSEKNA